MLEKRNHFNLDGGAVSCQIKYNDHENREIMIFVKEKNTSIFTSTTVQQ